MHVAGASILPGLSECIMQRKHIDEGNRSSAFVPQGRDVQTNYSVIYATGGWRHSHHTVIQAHASLAASKLPQQLPPSVDAAAAGAVPATDQRIRAAPGA